MSDDLEQGLAPGLRFSGQKPVAGQILFPVSHPTGYLDDALSAAFIDAVKVLVSAIGSARIRANPGSTAAEKALAEILIGFGLLAANEARAFIIVAGAGLDRHARIHFRSIMEYEFRVRRLLEDPQRAKDFVDAYAHEARTFARDLETVDESAMEEEIERVLGSAEGGTGPEKRALFGKGGQVKQAMSELPDGGRRYVGTFGWPSQISHGSIMALREIARAIDGVGGEFLESASRDGYGNRLAYNLIWALLHLADQIAARFLIPIAEQRDPVVINAMAINDRLGIISKDEEATLQERLRKAAESKRKA